MGMILWQQRNVLLKERLQEKTATKAKKTVRRSKPVSKAKRKATQVSLTKKENVSYKKQTTKSRVLKSTKNC